jgi:multidrug efflux pump subunit AcrA (membrane-fusion protein)
MTFRKIGFWLVLALVLMAAGGGYAYYSKVNSTSQATAEPAVQTSVARQGSLVISASGTGSVIAETEISIGFDESGILTDLLVVVGDEVKAGDVLARLQTKNTPEDIALAITNAELNVLKYQKALDDLRGADVTLELAKAKLAVTEAQQALDDLNAPADLSLAQAQVALISARQTLTDTVEERERLNYQRCADSAVESYEAQYYLALDKYNNLKDRYAEDYAPLPSNDPDRLNALAALLAAEEQVQKALANVNWCKGAATAEEIAQADADVYLAKATVAEKEELVEQIKNGPDPDQVALAEAEIEAAEAEVERLENYPDSYDVALAEAQLANAQAELAQAQETQAVIELIAPMDGTILSINAVKGESIGTNAFITLADLSQPMLEIYLDESDMNSVGVNYEIEVVFDALPNQTFTGRIVSVDPSLTSLQNVTAIRALAELDLASYAKPQTLPVGLNASVEVIASKAENVLLVPVEALRELSAGKYGVFVMENGEPVLRVVEVGLMDFTYAEIKSGLDAGDVVTTGIVETGQ